MVLSSSTDTTRKVAALNDSFRTTFLGGTICITAGLHLIGDEFVKRALLAVREFSVFAKENDPHGEHDFGAIDLDGRKLYWKIDYYDPTMLFGSDDPSNIENTRRVLTVMLAEEY